jgi:dTDP-4-amino-4,6-dideoxygalactose transaminase
MVYYPQPLHLQEAFRHLNYKVGDLPVAEAVARSVLALPMHSELTEEQQAYIVQHTVDFMAKQA